MAYSPITENYIEKLTKVALDNLDIDTLEKTGHDGLDFHEVAVWQVKRALVQAFELGWAECNEENRLCDEIGLY